VKHVLTFTSVLPKCSSNLLSSLFHVIASRCNLIEPAQQFTFLSSVTFLCLLATMFCPRMRLTTFALVSGTLYCVVSTSVHSSSSDVTRQTNSSLALLYCSFSISIFKKRKTGSGQLSRRGKRTVPLRYNSQQAERLRCHSISYSKDTRSSFYGDKPTETRSWRLE
jgi:hypothetical protein